MKKHYYERSNLLESDVNINVEELLYMNDEETSEFDEEKGKRNQKTILKMTLIPLLPSLRKIQPQITDFFSKEISNLRFFSL